MEQVVVEGGPVTRAALGLGRAALGREALGREALGREALGRAVPGRAALGAASRDNAVAPREAMTASPQERLIMQRGRKSLPLTWSPIELRRPPPAPGTPPRRSPKRLEARLELRRIPLTPEKIDFSHIKTPKKFVVGSPVKSPTSPPRKRPRLTLEADMLQLPLAATRPARAQAQARARAGSGAARRDSLRALLRARQSHHSPATAAPHPHHSHATATPQPRHSERQRAHHLRDRLTL